RPLQRHLHRDSFVPREEGGEECWGRRGEGPSRREGDGMKNFKDRMIDSSIRRASTIVLALDIGGPYSERKGRAMRVLDATGEGIAAVKVNQHLLLPFGLEGIRDVIQKCRKLGLPLIADLKLNDVESTNLSVVESLLDHEFDAVIANPFVGRREGLEKV